MRAAWICGVAQLVIGCDPPYGKVDEARSRARDIAQYAERHRVEFGRYPESIDALTKDKPDGRQPYLPEEAIRDHWGKPFQHKVEKDADGVERVEVFTFSPRGQRLSHLTGAR